MSHKITNDVNINKIKDNFKVPMIGEIKEDEVRELFNRLKLNYDLFFDYVYKNSEYYTDNGKKSFLIKDVAKVIGIEINKYKEALIWCSGSEDFQYPDGKARIGWEKIVKELVK